MSERWLLGDTVVDLATQRVERADGTTRLSPRATAVLRALVACGNRPLLREEALNQVWAQSATGDEVVSKAINELRQALADTDPRQRRFIETIPKRGYRLVCSVAPIAEPIAAAPVAVTMDVLTPAAAAAQSRAADETDAATDNTATARTGDTPAPEPAVARVERRRGRERGIEQRATPRLHLIWVVLGFAAVAAAVFTLRPLTLAPARYTAESLRRDLAQTASVAIAAQDYAGYVTVLPDAGAAIFATAQPEGLRLHRRELKSGADRPLSPAGQGDELAPAISHDGRWLAFAALQDGQCRLQLRNLADGSQRSVAPCSLRFAEWLEFTPDGSALLLPRLRPGETVMSLHRLELASGSVSALHYPRDATLDDMQARYSPDGRWLAVRRGAQPHSALVMLDLRRQQSRELLSDDWGLDGFAWLPDSKGLIAARSFGSDAGLWRVALDGRRDFLGRRGANCPVVAEQAGTLLFTAGPRRFGIHSVVVDTAADAEPRQPFAQAQGNDWYPRWSADGSALAFLSDAQGTTALRLVVDGVAHTLAAPPGYTPTGSPSFSSDSRQVLLPMSGSDGLGVLQAYDRDTAQWLRIGERHGVEEAVASHDGRWIYLAVNEAGRRSLWRRSRESGSEQQLAGGLARSPLAVDTQGGVFFIDAATQTLLRQDAAGARVRILDDMGYWNAYGWSVAGDQVYALLEPGGRDFGLYRIVAAQPPQWLEPLDGTASLGLALKADARELLLSRPPRGGLDVQQLQLQPLPR